MLKRKKVQGQENDVSWSGNYCVGDTSKSRSETPLCGQRAPGLAQLLSDTLANSLVQLRRPPPNMQCSCPAKQEQLRMVCDIHPWNVLGHLQRELFTVNNLGGV